MLNISISVHASEMSLGHLEAGRASGSHFHTSSGRDKLLGLGDSPTLQLRKAYFYILPTVLELWGLIWAMDTVSD